MNIFGGMKILWIFWGAIIKNELYFEVISMHFRVFSQGQCTEWGIFWGGGGVGEISNILGGA